MFFYPKIFDRVRCVAVLYYLLCSISQASGQQFIPLPSSITATAVLDTPGSNVNRRVHWMATMNAADKTAEMTLTSPWKKITFNGNGQCLYFDTSWYLMLVIIL